MLKRNAFVIALAVAMLGICSVGDAQEKDKQEITLDGIKCLFCKMDVSKDIFVEYKGAKVFLGCAGCVGAFEEKKAEIGTKANAQLVATKQARQKACPVTGKPYKDEFKLAVGKAEVAFCCPNCKEATAKLEGDAQLEKVFSETAFKKAFEVVKWEKKKDKQQITLDGIKCLFCKMDVSKDVFVEYKGARVFLGCAGCVGAFEEKKTEIATKANAQLVATNQARQKACPVTGKPYKDEFKLAVGKAEVAFCCPNCKEATAKLEGDAQLEKVFSEAAFKKAFEVLQWEKK